MPFVNGLWIPQRDKEPANPLASPSGVERRQGARDALVEAQWRQFPDIDAYGYSPYAGFTATQPEARQTGGGLRKGVAEQRLTDRINQMVRDLRSTPEGEEQYQRANQTRPFEYGEMYRKFQSGMRTEKDRDFMRGTYERYRQIIEAEKQAALDAISADYQNAIGKLEHELGHYATGVEDVNAAYSEYAKDAGAAFEEAAAVEANPLPDVAIEKAMGAGFDQFSEQLQAALQTMGADSPALAVAMGDQLLRFEDVLVDAARTGQLSQAEMHDLVAGQAQALAHMTWKDDAYQAEKARYGIELDINKAIAAKEQELMDTREQMNRALADAAAQFDQFDASPEELWNTAMQDLFVHKGLDAMQRQTVTALWDDILQTNPQAAKDYDTFKGEVMRAINKENLARSGLLNNFLAMVDYYGRQAASDDEDLAQSAQAELARIENIITSPQSPIAFKNILDAMSRVTGANLGQLPVLTDIDWDRLIDPTDTEYTTMLDLWSHHDDFTRNYDRWVSERNNQYTINKGGNAPNNYANRYHPDYVYRREQWAPKFAEIVKRSFPNSGVEIGGLGYMRSPDDVGGGRVANSDHQSGGAIDIYAKDEASRLAIARWARSQPGVSYVTYEGNKAHEGHHVHVSLAVGYRFPTV